MYDFFTIFPNLPTALRGASTGAALLKRNFVGMGILINFGKSLNNQRDS
jgi:hypothetical protein